ncbi:MAG: invasion associated locus B family protein [Candidatus Tectimicrobiota bacterium]
MYLRALVMVLVMLSWATLGVAQTLEGEFKNWRVYTLQRDGQKTCYLSSSPTDRTGSAKRRSEPYFLVTYRDKQTSEISVSAGYAYLPKSSVALAIDSKRKYALFTSDKTPEIAWARDAAEDRSIVEAMSKGGKATVAASGPKKAASTDTYVLAGFAEAHTRMQELCQKAPDKATKPGRGQKAGSDGKQEKASAKEGSKSKESSGAAPQGKASETKGKDSKAGESKGKDSKAGESKGKDSKTGESKGKDNKAGESKGKDTKNR